jgi:hypothetical protein
MSRCIVNVSVGWKYPIYQKRLLKSLELVGYKGAVLTWTEEYPPGSPTHKETRYNFKQHAFLEAFRRGHTSVLWMDASSYAIRPLDPIFEEIEKVGYFVPLGCDTLDGFISDAALAYFGMTREEAKSLRLSCTTVYGLNANSPLAMEFLNKLMECAKGGLTRGHAKRRGEEPIVSVLGSRLKMNLTSVGGLFQGNQRSEKAISVVRSGKDQIWEPWDQLRLVK